MNTSPITMYSTTWCGYCKRLKRQLDEAGVSYVEINIEEDSKAATFVESVNGGNQTVPTILYSDGSAVTNPSARDVIAKLSELQPTN
jgi:mycoredoxin